MRVPGFRLKVSSVELRILKLDDIEIITLYSIFGFV